MGASPGRTGRRAFAYHCPDHPGRDGRRHHAEERGGSITPKDATTALADFQLDFARQYFIIEVSAPPVAQAASLARKHALRGYDAVQLAATLDSRARLPSLTLLSADADLNTAASAEGLAVDDPNSHP